MPLTPPCRPTGAAPSPATARPPWRSRAACGTWSSRSGSRARPPAPAAVPAGSRSSSTSASSQCRSFVSDSARFKRSGTERLSVAVGAAGVLSLVDAAAGVTGIPAWRSASSPSGCAGNSRAIARSCFLAPAGSRASADLGDSKARQRHVGGGRRRLLDERRVGLGRRGPIALHPEAVGDPERRHRGRPAAPRMRGPLERRARGVIVAVVELALAEEKGCPVLVAQLLAERGAQRLRGVMVFAGAVRGEPARQVRGRFRRRRRSVRRPQRDGQTEA